MNLLFLETNEVVVFFIVLLVFVGVIVGSIVAYKVTKKVREEKKNKEKREKEQKEKEEYDNLTVVGKVCKSLYPASKEGFSLNGKYNIDWNNPDAFFLGGTKIQDREWDELFKYHVKGFYELDALVMLFLINRGEGWARDYNELEDCASMAKNWFLELGGFNTSRNHLLNFALKIGTFKNKTRDKMITLHNLFAKHFIDSSDLARTDDDFILLNKELYEKTTNDEFVTLTENYTALNELDLNRIRESNINDDYNNLPDFDDIHDVYQYLYFKDNKLRNPKEISDALYYTKGNARKLYDD